MMKLEKSNSANAPARVEIQLKNGSIHERTVQFAKGTIQNPMTKEELKDKFRELTSDTPNQGTRRKDS